jgi:hypothetical protein
MTMKISRVVKVLVLIGAGSLLALALACASTTLPSTGDGQAWERSVGSSIVRVTSAANDFRAELTTDRSAIVAGQPTSLILNIKNASGELVRDLQIVHEKPIHLILISDDLAEFNHLHPEAQSDGSYRVNFSFPHGGGYRLYADFTPARASQVVEQYKLTVSGTVTPSVALAEDKSLTKSVDGLRVTMQPSRPLRAGEELLLDFIVADEATGKPVTDLQPYLGSLAHFVIITEDTSKYLHVHPMEAGAMSGINDEGMAGKMDEQMNAGPLKEASKVVVSAHTTFQDAGLYKLWAQFQRAGKVITIPFVLRVNAGETTASKPEASDSLPPGAIKVAVSSAGYEPARIEVKQGQAVKLAFYRVDAKNCGAEVVFPSLGIRKLLPVGKTTLVEVTPKASGDLAFTCGAGMLRGSLVVSQ